MYPRLSFFRPTVVSADCDFMILVEKACLGRILKWVKNRILLYEGPGPCLNFFIYFIYIFFTSITNFACSKKIQSLLTSE